MMQKTDMEYLRTASVIGVDDLQRAGHRRWLSALQSLSPGVRQGAFNYCLRARRRSSQDLDKHQATGNAQARGLWIVSIIRRTQLRMNQAEMQLSQSLYSLEPDSSVATFPSFPRFSHLIPNPSATTADYLRSLTTFSFTPTNPTRDPFSQCVTVSCNVTQPAYHIHCHNPPFIPDGNSLHLTNPVVLSYPFVSFTRRAGLLICP